MSVDRELLELLVCPKSRAPLEVVTLNDEVCSRLVAKYREHFADEEPVVKEGLLCRESGLVYPVVSDVPILLIDAALSLELAGLVDRDGGGT
jgi:uncharacterized protein YbaR (Trm112 family)